MSKNLFKSTFTVSSMTFLSRILGFLREVICAYVFGASAGFDAFIVAFKIPNFMRRLFAEGAFMQAFVPVLSEYREQHSREEILQFIQRMLGCLGIILLLVVALAEVIAPFIIMVFAPGFIDEPLRFGLANHMLRITAPYLFLIAMTAFAGAILNTYSVFSVPAFTPVLLNLAMIVGALFFAPHFAEPVYGLAWGVLLGGAIQLLFQLPFLWRLRLLPIPRVNWRDPGVRRVLKLMVPALFGVSVAQISLLIDTLFASFLPTGSVSWLYFSDRLMNFPLGVFGVALATVVLPHLSRKHADREPEAYSKALDWALRSVFVVGVPAALGLLFLAGPLLATLFHYGKFDTYDVIMTRKSLIAFAVGVPSFMLVKVLASGFYARQNIGTPVRIAALAMVTNIVLNAILIFPLAHAGLALATSLSSTLNAGLLLRSLLKCGIYRPQSGWRLYLLRLAIASVAMAVLLWFGSGHLEQWTAWRWYQRCGHLLLWIAAGMAVYFVCLWITGVRLRDFRMSPEVK